MALLYRLVVGLAALVGAVAVSSGVGPTSLVSFYQPELPPELRED